jgi:hypothetical protein
VFAVLFLAVPLNAEAPGGTGPYTPAGGPPAGAYPYSPPGGPPGRPQNGYGWGVNLLNDDIFKLSVDKQAPTTTKSSVSGSERYLDAEPDYNTEQRSRWIKECGGGKEQDPKAYGECYREKKERELGAVRRKNNGESNYEPPVSNASKNGTTAPPLDLEEIRNKGK